MKTVFKSLILCVLILLYPAIAFPAFAATLESPRLNPVLLKRINQIPALMNGRIKPVAYFTDSFLAEVSVNQFDSIRKNLLTQYGPPIKLVSISPTNDFQAVATLLFEKASAQVDIAIDPKVPNKVSGLRISDIKMTGDSIDKIKSDFTALPGKAGFVIQTLTDGGTQENGGLATDTQFAIGSTFKLYILAELASQIEAGERKWSDVVPLSKRSFSSTATRSWPKDTPMTLQTLATMMISVSDNSATDTLLAVLGRSAVEQKLATIGHSDPDKALPFLSTVEAFAMKSKASAALRDRFLKANEAGQRALLTSEASKLGFEQVDPAAFADGPAFIDTLEWFASPKDIGALMNNLHRINNKTALEIMGVNTGVASATVANWKYLGYKGGSEPGVISMSFLGVTPKGQWKVVSGSWNNPAKTVDEATFVTLMTRLLDNAVR